MGKHFIGLKTIRVSSIFLTLVIAKACAILSKVVDKDLALVTSIVKFGGRSGLGCGGEVESLLSRR